MRNVFAPTRNFPISTVDLSGGGGGAHGDCLAKIEEASHGGEERRSGGRKGGRVIAGRWAQAQMKGRGLARLSRLGPVGKMGWVGVKKF